MSRATTTSQLRQGRFLYKLGMLAIAPMLLFAACSSGGDGGGGTTTNNPPGALTNLGATSVTAQNGAPATAPSVAVDPTSSFLFVGVTNGVTVFNIDPNTGNISGQKVFVAGNTPHNVTADSNGHVYTANINANTVSAFSNNAGTLTSLAADVATGNGPNQAVVHPNGQVLFTADQGTNTVTRFTVGANGTLTPNGTAHIFPGGSETNGIGFTNNPPGAGNQFAYVVNYTGNNVQAFTSDGNGNLTAVGNPMTTGTNPHNVNVDKAGRFVYISNHGSNFVSGYKINADGSLAQINNAAGSPVTNLQGNDATDNNPHWSVFDPTGQFLYVIAGVPPAMSTLKKYSVNADGTLTQLASTGPLANCLHGHNVTITPNNKSVYVACEDSAVVYSFTP